jgi:hypothetical protein
MQSDFDRVAERGDTDHFDFFVLQQPHFQEPLADPVFAEQRLDSRPLPESELIE